MRWWYGISFKKKWPHWSSNHYLHAPPQRPSTNERPKKARTNYRTYSSRGCVCMNFGIIDRSSIFLPIPSYWTTVVYSVGGMGMNIFDLSIIPKFIHILPVLYNRAVISAGLFWFLICWASKIRQKGKKSLIFWPKNPDHYWVHVTRYCVEDFFFQMLSRIDLCYFAKFIQISKRNFHLKFLMCIWPLFFFFFQGFTRAHIFCEITMKNAKQWYKFCCQIRSRSRLDRPHSCVSCKK